MSDIVTTVKECIEQTISDFASDPRGFLDDEKHIENQYNEFKRLSLEYDIDFKETMCSWNSGKKLYEAFELKNDIKFTIDNNHIEIKRSLEKEFKELEKSIKKLDESMKLISKYGDLEKVGDALFAKNYADGLIKNLDNANLKQLERMKNNLAFFRVNSIKYYTDEYLSNLLEQHILKKKRNIVLQQLKDDN